VDDESKAMDPDRVRTLLSAAVEALGGSERPGQMEMADAVAAAMTEAEHLLVQAGTGTGKSLAYLVPALLYADAADKPAIIATATLALQAQLVDRDLPLLAGAVEPELGRPLGWATASARRSRTA
jgi:ATP-dependent DNA helicase DinG